MNTLSTLLIVIVLLGVAFFIMAVKVIFSKHHEFSNTHIGGNKNMIKNGITCAQSWDKMEQKKAKKELKFKKLKLSSN